MNGLAVASKKAGGRSMAVQAGEIMPGDYFMTAERELRKVYRVAADGHGCRHVWYQCKPATLPAQPLLFGHTQAKPLPIEDFAAQCAYRLSEPELRQLRSAGVLLEYE